MNITAAIPLCVAVIAAVGYLANATNPGIRELARLTFVAAVFVLLLGVAGESLHLGASH